MSVTVQFECGGCDAKAQGTAPLRREFRSFSGRRYGVGGTVQASTVEDVAPEGWMPYDPYTYATYCPDCWRDIAEDREDEDEWPTDYHPERGELGGAVWPTPPSAAPSRRSGTR